MRLAIVSILFALCCYAPRWGEGYHLVNHDSFWFGWLAKRITTGDSVDVVASGLAYPLSWLSNIVGMSSASAILPIALGLLTMVILYWGVSRLLGPSVALGACICFALSPTVHYTFMAGNVDRDCLHFPIVTAGLLCLALYWKEHRPLWLVGLFASIGLLTLEWGVFGLFAYLPLLAGVTVFTAWDHRQAGPWALLALLSVAAYVAGKVIIPWMGFSTVTELQPLGLMNLLEYVTIAIPVGFGMYASWRSPGNWPLWWWMLSGAFGCFALRMGQFGIIGACIVGGIGLCHIWVHRRVWVAAVAVTAVAVVGMCWRVPDSMSMSPEWQEALEWIRDNTPPESRILARGDRCHWIRYVAERTPVLEVARPYSIASPQEMMAEYGADYMIIEEKYLWILPLDKPAGV